MFHPLWGKGGNGRRSTHVNHDPKLQRSRLDEILEEKFCAVRKNATVKNIITINKYNVGIKNLVRAIIFSDTLSTETSPIFILRFGFRCRFRFRFRFRLRFRFRIPAFPYARFLLLKLWERIPFQIGDSPSTLFLYLCVNFHKCVSVAIQRWI